MALRNQPYLRLFVDDYLSDEKLAECSSSANGVFIRIICLMHKSEQYGIITLKQKDKQNYSFASDFAIAKLLASAENLLPQNDSTISFFATKLLRHLPYTFNEIKDGLKELIDEKVLDLEGDSLIQKRMVKDNYISVRRSEIGTSGATKRYSKKKKEKEKSFAIAKPIANYGYVNVNVNEDIINKEKGVQGKKQSDLLERFKLYYEDFIKIKSNAPPKWDGVQINAAKSIISFLKTLDKIKDDDGVIVAWRHILDNWDKLDSFHAYRVKLSEISSDMTNILSQIKNPKTKINNTNGTAKKTLASTIYVSQNQDFGNL